MTFVFNIYIPFISFEQKSCISFAIEAKPLELYVPPENNGMRYHIWRLVTSGPFENIIMFLIIGNTVLLMLKVKSKIIRAKPDVIHYVEAPKINEEELQTASLLIVS